MRHTYLSGLALALTLSLAGAAAAETIEFIPNIAMRIGAGFDSLSGQVKRCPFQAPQVSPIPGGQSVTSNMDIVESSEELEQALDVSAGGSYGKGLFSVSAKAAYMREEAVDRYSLYTVVSVKVKDKEESLWPDPVLSQEAKELLDQPNGLELFHKAYGDRFIAGIAYGGEYYGVYRIETRSESEKERFGAELSASGWGATLDAKVASTMAKHQSESRLSVKNIFVGGASLAVPTDAKGMMDFARGFPAKVREAPMPVYVILSDFSVFPAYERKLAGVDITQKLVLCDVAYTYVDYQVMKNDLTFVLTHPGQFRFQNDRHKAQLLATLEDQKRKIEKLLAALLDAKNGIVERRLKPTKFDELGIPPAELFGEQVALPPRYRDYLPDGPLPLAPVPLLPFDWVRKGTMVERVGGGETVKAGDADIHGHSPRIRLRAALSVDRSRRRVDLDLTGVVQESKKDWTTFTKRHQATVLDLSGAHPHLRVKSVTPDRGSLDVQAGVRDQVPHTYQGQNLIKEAQDFRSDFHGYETGRVGTRAVVLNPPTVTYAHAEDVDGKPPYALIPYVPTQEPAAAAAAPDQPRRGLSRFLGGLFRGRRPPAPPKAPPTEFWFNRALEQNPALKTQSCQ